MFLARFLVILASITIVNSFVLDGRAFKISQQVLTNQIDPNLFKSHQGNEEYKSFINHFSANTVGTSTYLADSIRKLNLKYKSFIVTQARELNYQSFATNPLHKVKITEVNENESIIIKWFLPAMKRKDGEGVLGDQIIFAEFDLEWESVQFKLFKTSFVEGFNFVEQIHILSDSALASEQLILAVSKYVTNTDGSILVFDQGFWHKDRKLYDSVQKASWEDVILDSGLKNSLINEYTSFYKSEKVYKDLGVAWKRGLIFLGPPGNGKTISTKAIMKAVDVPILYVKSFQSWGGDELGIRMIFEKARQQAPCLLVLEDLDSLITDENRSFFLNEVDGLEDNDGLLLIGTTNHFDKLDPALSSRPSRFDRKYNFPNPSRPERIAYAHYWKIKLTQGPGTHLDFPDELEIEVANLTENFSFSHIKEGFVSTLLLLAGQDEGEKLEFREVLLDQIKILRKEIENGDKEVRFNYIV